MYKLRAGSIIILLLLVLILFTVPGIVVTSVYALSYPDKLTVLPVGSTTVTAGEPFTVATRLTNYTNLTNYTINPIKDITVNIDVLYANNSIDSFTGVTDTDGYVVYTDARLSPYPVKNLTLTSPDTLSFSTANVIYAQIPSKSLMSSCIIYNKADSPSSIYLESLRQIVSADSEKPGVFMEIPNDSVYANGKDHHEVIVRAVDKGGNNIDNQKLQFTDEYGNTMLGWTNANGIAKMASMPSNYDGSVKYTVSPPDDLSTNLTLNLHYLVGAPAIIELTASPGTIASSDVIKNEKISYDINRTLVKATVMDKWNHVLPYQTVNFSVLDPGTPHPAGKGYGTLNAYQGITDAAGPTKGEVSTTFSLDDQSYISTELNNSGYVYVNATTYNGTYNTRLDGSVSIRYTNESYLNITTTVLPRKVRPNQTVNVTINIDGVGWKSGRSPVDLMLVMDRSGSMGDPWYGWFGPSYVANYSAATIVPDNTYQYLTTYDHDINTRMIVRLEPWTSTMAGMSQQKPNAAPVSPTSVPAYIVAGETASATITMQNTGTVPWTNDDQFSLVGYNSAASTFNGGITPVMALTPDDANITAGGTTQFTFDMTAPNVAGGTSYSPSYQMRWGTGYFGTAYSRTVYVVQPGDYAKYSADSIPSTMTPGTTYNNLNVRFTNYGSTTWTNATGYYMGGKADASSFGFTRSDIPVGTKLMPTNTSSTSTFKFNLKAPTTPGTYTLTFQMHNSTGYFADSFTKTVTVSASSSPVDGATYISNDIPSDMWSGNSYKVNVTMQNTGTTTWTSGSSYQLTALNDATNFGSSAQSVLVPHNVAPGETVKFTFTMTAPTKTSITKYTNLKFGMKKGTTSFGSQTPSIAVRVLPNADIANVVTSTYANTMESGSTQTVSVTMKNMGGYTWKNASYTLQPYSTDASKFTVATQYIPVGVEVPPEGSYVFTYDITAPTVASDKSYSPNFYMYNRTNRFSNGFIPTILVYKAGEVHRHPITSDPTYGTNDVYWVEPYIGGVQVADPDPSTSTYGTWFFNHTYFGGYYSNDKNFPSNNTDPGDWGYSTSSFNQKVLTSSSKSLPAGSYDIMVKRKFSTGSGSNPGTYNDIQLSIYDDMKLGQWSDNDSAAKRGAKTFLTYLQKDNLSSKYDYVGLVTFNSTATTDVSMKRYAGNESAVLNKINTSNSLGGTAIGLGMQNARWEFENHTKTRPDEMYVEVLMTDGWSDEDKAYIERAEVPRAVTNGITLYTIGIGNDHSEVNETFLSWAASETGGHYYFVKDASELNEAFKDIGRRIEQNVSTSNSYIDVNMNKSQNLNASWSNNLSYVPGTAFTMVNRNLSTLKSSEPNTSVSEYYNTYNWNITPIGLGENWTLNYTLKADKRGYAYPIGNTSIGVFQMVRESNVTEWDSVYFHSDYVLVDDNLTDNMTDPNYLSISIVSPENNAEINYGFMPITWDVNYNNTIDNYTQVLEYAPAGTNDYKLIAMGFSSNKTKQRFNYDWDISNIQLEPIKYTLRIRASDSLFYAEESRTIQMEYIPGQISIVSNNGRL